MKVLIDAHTIGSGEGGNERYITNLISTVRASSVRVIEFTSVFPAFIRYFWELPRWATRSHADIVLTTYFTVPYVRHPVVVVHDVAFLRHPQFFSLRLRLQFLAARYLFRYADAIIVPTQFTRSEFTHFYPHYKDRVYVIADGADIAFYPLPENKRRQLRAAYSQHAHVYVAIGSAYGKRNPYIFVDALKHVDPDSTLYILGSRAQLHRRDNGYDVRYLNHISDQKLNELYNIATALLYHSAYEGFGLPIVEAFATHTPVIASDIPALREVGGMAPLYFDNAKPASLIHALDQVVHREEIRSHMIKQGRHQLSRFSWEKCGQETISVWEKVLSE
jgi:glycosyltransferase involved in cell wall biosynthesis